MRWLRGLSCSSLFLVMIYRMRVRECGYEHRSFYLWGVILLEYITSKKKVLILVLRWCCAGAGAGRGVFKQQAGESTCCIVRACCSRCGANYCVVCMMIVNKFWIVAPSRISTLGCGGVYCRAFCFAQLRSSSVAPTVWSFVPCGAQKNRML